MKTIELLPSRLSGEITIPPSKSLLHRCLLAAALSQGRSKITNFMFSKDISATLDAVCAMQVPFDIREDCIIIEGGVKSCGEIQFDANESGSTLRFVLPIALALGDTCTSLGAPRLFERHMEPYFEIFERQGITYQQEEARLTVKGRLSPGKFSLPGDVSSQFVTGLLFALPLLNSDSEIEITSPLESKDYVELTLFVLQKFGIQIEHENHRLYRIAGGQQYQAQELRVEGDFSQAAFFLVAGALGSDVVCKGLHLDSLQGDKRIVELLKQCGALVSASNGRITCRPGSLCGISVDCSQIPDLVPILAVLFSFCEGESQITNVRRLRFKESDRLHAITQELNRLGAKIQEFEDRLVIQGVNALHGGVVDSHNDHRIAMSLAVASTRADGAVRLSGPECVQKSMPQFFEEYKRLGGKAVE